MKAEELAVSRKDSWRYIASLTLTTGGSECLACLQQSHVRFSVEISVLTDILLLYDLRSGLGDAAFYEISLNFEFLLRAQVHHGIEGQVAG